LNNPDTPGEPSDFQQRLLVTWQGAQVAKLARIWAPDRDLAEDALQTAYYKVARVPDPDRIQNLHAYLLKVLRNEIKSLLASRRATPLEYQETARDLSQPGTLVCGTAQCRPIDEAVGTSLLGRDLVVRLAVQRDCLLADIPARSDDPAHYRAVIFAAAEQVLRDGLNGEPSDADSNDALRGAYPDYFDQPGAALNTLHQRFRRARDDVKTLLQTIVSKDELC
jgi:DNA-directed RNA polymerase specialized sigma24 family protein